MLERIKLRTLNIVIAVIQAVLVIALVAYIALKAKDPQLKQGLHLYSGEYLAPENSRTLKSYDATLILGLLAAFSAVTCAFHGLYASQGLDYMAMVRRGNNSFRWVEYSISATVILVVIALSSGVFELNAQIFIAVACVCTMLCGDMVEKSLGARSPIKGVVLLATVVGWLLLLTAYGLIFKSFGEAMDGTVSPGKKPPWFVSLIVVVMFFMYMSFGGVQLYDIKVRMGASAIPESHGMDMEKLYSMNSVFSKLFLVLFLFGGIAARSEGKGEEEKEEEEEEEEQ